MLGRPILYAIAADGERGLQTLVRSFVKDIKVTMAQIGATDLSSVNQSFLID